jgi:hypothetical protein
MLSFLSFFIWGTNPYRFIYFNEAALKILSGKRGENLCCE